jgi:hypothetical protein
MKRMIAVFLLIATSLASGHATWVFHYCSGTLRNVGLAGYTEAQACCCTGRQREASSGNRAAVGNKPCCVNLLVSPSTDDYPAVRQEKETPFESSRAFHPAPSAANSLFRLCECASPLLPRVLASGCAARHGAALRRLICIYRI